MAWPPLPLARRRQSGFTLIEVVIAFALLAGALTLLVGALSNAGRQVRDAEDVSRATLHAQTLLAQAGVGVTLASGTQAGEFEDGRFRWVLQVTPYRDAAGDAAMPPAAATARLLQLDLEVRWGDGPRQRLQQRTLRLVRADGGGGG